MSWFKFGEKAAGDPTSEQARAAEHAAQLRLNAVQQTQPIVEFGLDGRIFHANAAFCGLVGLTPDEIRSQPLSRFMAQKEGETTSDRAFWDGLARGEAQTGALRLTGSDSREVWLQMGYAPIPDANGKTTRFVGTGVDITALVNKLAQDSLELKLRSDIMDMTSIVSYADTKGDIVSVNEKFIEVSKYSRDELIGKPHNTTRHPDMPKEVFKDLWQTIGRGKMFRGVIKNRAKDGTPYYVDAVIAPIMGANGKPKKYLGVRYDITEMETERQNMRGLLDAINASFAYIEFDTTGTILNANANFLSLMGYQLGDVVGKPHRMFVDPDYASSPAYAEFWTGLAAGKAMKDVFKRFNRAGGEVWIQAVYAPVRDETGRVTKVVKIASDVSEQVRSTQFLQQAVKDTQQVVTAAKENDLTKRIPLEGKSGEIEALCAGVNGLLDTMAAIIGSTTEAASTISTAVSEITSGTDDLSRRTETQASSLQETSASMEEIASTIRQNSDNAQQASKLAVDARSVATSGGEIVTKAVAAMSKIEESSGKVSDIIGVIDEIAFQTNLLALNAAVEAARAGDAGRGFAVVASEVRSLAQRSGEAAKDIKALIVQSGSQVKDGVKLVNDAGLALGEIVTSVKRVSDIVAEIASASREQSVGAEEINRAISQMDEMTQQNSALVEENAAACRLLQDQADDMAARMGQFRVDGITASNLIGQKAAPRKPATPAKPTAERAPVRAPIRATGTGARAGAAALQSNLRTAFADDQDWKEF